MPSSENWFERLLNEMPTNFPSAQQLIEFSGGPTADADRQRYRGLIGLVESSWANPLFYPSGGYPKQILDRFYDLPSTAAQSLLSAYSQARGLSREVNVHAFVLAENPDGVSINGSRNQWVAMSSLSSDQLTRNGAIYYYDSNGKRNSYNHSILPEKLDAATGTDEFTLDILGAHTYNQLADLVVYIVPYDTLDLGPDASIDLPDYRLAPLPADAQELPLVVSSSNGGFSSQRSRRTGNSNDFWPSAPNLPSLYSQIDNTGLVLTLSAGDQISGIDFADTGEDAQPLTFNTLPSSSSILLTVGGSKLIKEDGRIKGAEAWRHPVSSGQGAAMEGGNGGFTAAVAAPDYQRSSPWVNWFQQKHLDSSLAEAWTEPLKDRDGKLFPWWQSKGESLSLDHGSFADQSYNFYADAQLNEYLNIDPARMRSMPDLSNLAWKDDFLSIHLNIDEKGGVALDQPDWTRSFSWKGDGGTSLASPATAALLTAVNARRRQRGLADLSATEVHAMLYQIRPGVLTDVTRLQQQPHDLTSAYGAHPGFDFASGLGSVGNTSGTSLVTVLAETLLPVLAQGDDQANPFLFKPSGLSLLLQNLRGGDSQLQLVAMNGFAVQALLAAQEVDPRSLSERLLATLAEARQQTSGQPNAVDYSVVPLSDRWSGGNPGSLLRRPLADFLATEAVPIASDSLVPLAPLPDIFASASGSQGMPAWYALLHLDSSGRQSSLRLHPFLPNRGTLLGQGGLLVGDGADQEASLVLPTLQRPLLVADVARSLGSSSDGARVSLQLHSVSGFASLYGLYPVLDGAGSLRDGQGQLLLPGDPGYAALAVTAAFGDGRDSLVWEAPHRGSRTFTHTRRWTDGAGGGEGRSLLEAIEPGALYQHFILTSPSLAERQGLIQRLIAGSPRQADLARAWFGQAAANADGLSHVVGLHDDSAFLSLGFEDLPSLGDRDFNDVIASWSVQDIRSSSGSLVLLDPAATRIAQLAAGSSSGSVSSVLLVDTETGKTLQHWKPFGETDTSGVQLGSGDINGDGFDDLVAVRASLSPGADPSLAGEVAVLLGDSHYNPSASSGPFSPPTPTELRFQADSASAHGPLSLAVRDLNGDGHAEILLCPAEADARRSGLPLQVWSRASGSFQPLAGLQLPSGVLDPRHGYSLAVGDLQGDGLAELVLGDLQGADLFVASIQPGASIDSLSLASGTVLQPYGKEHTAGVRPTAVSAQQTLIQRPAAFAAASLPSVLSLPQGIGPFPTDPLLGGLGTPGALIVQSGDATHPRPAQVPLSWLAGPPSEPLNPIPWSSTIGAPIFSSGGVSYPQPTQAQAVDGLEGSPAPVLVAGTAGSTDVQLLTYPTSGADSGQWQATSTPSANSFDFNTSGDQRSWIHKWTYADVPSNPADARERYGSVTTALVSYTTPFTIDLNPLRLNSPERLIDGLRENLLDFNENVVIPWNDNAADPSAVAWSGPSTPNSNAYPYAQPPAFPNQPDFRPKFQLVDSSEPGPASGAASRFTVQQFQQRLINAYFTSLASDYQHHYSPLWYSPHTWSSPEDPTPQRKYLPTPPGRQTQGMDCSHTSSWSYNLAFGLFLPYDISGQVTTNTVSPDWLTGATLHRTTGSASSPFTPVATALDIYGNAGDASPDQIIDYLNANLQPGDIIYLSGKDLHSLIAKNHSNPDFIAAFQNDITNDANDAKASHVITWINDNTGDSPLQFVSLPQGAPGGDQPKQAFVIDSTGSESSNFHDQAYPNGIQIRQFDQSIWYLNHISSVQRWLTPENVAIMAAHLP